MEIQEDEILPRKPCCILPARPFSSALNLISNDERLEETIKEGRDDEGTGRRADVTCYREEQDSRQEIAE